MSHPAVLPIEAFDGGVIPSTPRSLCVAELNANGDMKTDAELVVRYDVHGELTFEHAAPDGRLIRPQGNDAVASGGVLAEPVGLIAASRYATGTIFVPQRQPVLLKWSTDAISARAIIINAPSLDYCAGPLHFARGDFKFSLTATSAARAFYESAALHRHDAIATGIVSMRRADGGGFSPQDAIREFDHLRTFLTFVRGAGCGLGHVEAVDANGDLAFACLGFNAHDGLKVERGWSDAMAIRQATPMYELFAAAGAESDTRRVLRRAIDYYRASNVSRAVSKEVGLVSSYAALEALTPHILTNEASWTAEQLRAPFAQKLRAVTAFIGLSSDLFEHAHELQKRVIGNDDAFDILARMRNRVTHYKASFSCTGLELHEAWQASQWLCEILIMHILRYRGPMNDRRRYIGARGPLVATPLP
jgi:hypothetical protein